MGCTRMTVSLIKWSLKRWFMIFCCLGLTSMTWMLYKLSSPSSRGHLDFVAQYTNPRLAVNRAPSTLPSGHKIDIDDNQPQPTVENKALLIHRSSRTYSSVTIALLYSRLKFDTVRYKGSSKAMFTKNSLQGQYSIIIIEDLLIYIDMRNEDKSLISEYCKVYKVGIIFFTLPQPRMNSIDYDFPLSFSSVERTVDKYIVNETEFADIARHGVGHDMNHIKDWVQFHPSKATHRTLAYGQTRDSHGIFSLVVLDLGLEDGVVKLFFGQKHSLWIHKILFLDALSFLTNGAMKMSKTRLIQIDIDDIFLGSSTGGTKMKAVDALELKNAQSVWREHYVPGFNFYLGFNGKSYKAGLEEEADGDVELIKQAGHFHWFDHTWAHVQAHKYNNLSKLVEQMELSKAFAKEHNITVSRTYSVAPHHSGVYPVHEQLYKAWRKVWGIQVTSTEEYPHLNPPWFLRGYAHLDIKVLPRQVCGLYTKNLNYSSYPKGPEALERNILGGALFDTVLYNYVNVYMTHQQNYGHDRLAIYTFNKLFELFTYATTLKLEGAPPEKLAEDYFGRYPEELQPLWLNPCDDPRHMEIWNEEKSCTKLPSLLVVGPQKTGSTALYTFLKLHPDIAANRDSPTSYEELQFFGSPNYNKGLDWYMQFFTDDSLINFEKSATYFDKDSAAKQMSSLLPKARIIVILLDPIARALSWYHHQRAHNNTAAISLTFSELVRGKNTSKSAQSLLSQMMKPGFYYDHIQRLRKYYSDSQIMYIDGEKLKSDPVRVMSDVQDFINVDTKIDYGNLLRFDKEKGFYCIVISNTKSKCLGSGKGRSKYYADVDSETKEHLERVFAVPNSYLKRLLIKLGVPIPSWIEP
ncbi:bifunctional heparan sulfate N-deacetylase/N-sulfotransferase 4-like [Watersipora subatra]|uniref:bifunctional heparan sulfate N-deacetylase/N-sulfotransferase 4-like n=1 Tax=Watersipora subatra TaxID=2589382 RepID=UPI00355C80E4